MGAKILDSRQGKKNAFGSLRMFYRQAEFRRFAATHRSSRQAEFLGFGPDGKYVVGWWLGNEALVEFDPDDIQWTDLVTHL